MWLVIALVVGLAVGRLWARFVPSSRLADCPKCALDDTEQRARIEINSLRREAENGMTQAAQPSTPSGASPRHAAPKK